MTLSQTIDGFLLEQAARRLSPHMIADYTNGFKKLQSYLGSDPLLTKITVDQIDAAYILAQEFVGLVRERAAERLGAWEEKFPSGDPWRGLR